MTLKQQQFNAAMELYNSKRRYKLFVIITSLVNISLQLFVLFQVWPNNIGIFWQLFSIVTAYLFTDFVNGLVHLYMDNTHNYTSIAGPLIANFHLHHKIQHYKERPLLIIYFNETGSKVWLAGYLLILAFLTMFAEINPILLFVLLYVGILSSLAEVSHYLCHNSHSRSVLFLAKIGLLLSKEHHAKHHQQDNTNYAFLNGFTDPLINRIAKVFYPGYKQTTDLHYEYY